MKTKETYSNYHEAAIYGVLKGLNDYKDLIKKHPTNKDDEVIKEVNYKIDVLEKILESVESHKS